MASLSLRLPSSKHRLRLVRLIHISAALRNSMLIGNHDIGSVVCIPGTASYTARISVPKLCIIYRVTFSTLLVIQIVCHLLFRQQVLRHTLLGSTSEQDFCAESLPKTHYIFLRIGLWLVVRWMPDSSVQRDEYPSLSQLLYHHSRRNSTYGCRPLLQKKSRWAPSCHESFVAAIVVINSCFMILVQ